MPLSSSLPINRADLLAELSRLWTLGKPKNGSYLKLRVVGGFQAFLMFVDKTVICGWIGDEATVERAVHRYGDLSDAPRYLGLTCKRKVSR